MCGIAGQISISNKPSEVTLRRMIAKLSHRGPDNQEIKSIDDDALFGHTRLSIIDLSSSANQPMTDRSGRYVITYNGEVYNFREIRNELKKSGFVFQTESDTEVVLNAYIHWNTKAFEKFNGMFAMAVWDRKEKELVIARDRFGKKPLYYTELGNAFTFASELNALMEFDEANRNKSVSVVALNQYFALGYILSPETIYSDVYKLAPATFLRYRDGKVVEKNRYWDYAKSFFPVMRKSEEEIVHDLEYLFDQAVERRLVSDVPVGAFLSGGLDSSGVCAFAKKHLSYDLHTFSMGFQQASYNELGDAQIVAEYLDTRHHGEVQATQDGKAFIDNAISKYDEPFSDTSLVPMVSVAKTAASMVKVVLSGDGADEIFAGYPTYKADQIKSRLNIIPGPMRRLVGSVLSKYCRESSQKMNLGFKLKQFSKGIGQQDEYAHYSWRELHSEEERIALIGSEHKEEIMASHPYKLFSAFYDEVPDAEPLSRHLYVDVKTFLAEDILVKVDRATMAWSLEARAPFLDTDLAEYAAAIPASLKLRNGEEKYILKKMLSKHLPLHTMEKKKAGFNAPINSWLGNDRENEFRFFNKYVLESHWPNIVPT